MIKGVVLKVLVVAVGITLAGCPKQYNWSCPPLSKNHESSEVEPTKTFIQIDGTPSMRGFVSRPDSRYIRTLRLLDSAMGKTFPVSPSPTYFRFGTKRLKMGEMTSPRPAESAGFYDGSIKELQDARIDKIIEPLNPDTTKEELYVIVTDLYQKDAQWEALVKKLKDYYLLKDDHAVGILAVQSEFWGTVYDIGLEDRDFTNVRGNHPFYVIVLGSYENVKKYFDGIKSGSDSAGLNFEEDKLVIFSTPILEKPALLNIEGKHRYKGVHRVLSMNDGQVVVTVKPDQVSQVERLRFTEKAPEEVKLTYEVDYTPLPYILPLNFPLDYQINPEESDFNRRRKEFTELPAQDIMTLENWQTLERNKLAFDAALNFGSGSQTRGVYRLVVDVFPGKFSGNSKPYESPSWWRDWSFGERDPFNVSRTYNLQPFLEALAETTFRIVEKKQNSPVGRFCFVFQKS